MPDLLSNNCFALCIIAMVFDNLDFKLTIASSKLNWKDHVAISYVIFPIQLAIYHYSQELSFVHHVNLTIVYANINILIPPTIGQ